MGFNVSQIINKTVPITPTTDSKFSDELVKVPFREGYYVAETGNITFQRGGFLYNEDGSNTQLQVSVPAGLNLARIRFPFYGRKLGIRWLRDNNACDFSVMIDGVAYNVSGQHKYLIDEGASVSDAESLVMIEDALPDGVHYCDIQVSSPVSGTNAITFFGILVERRTGYEPRPRTNGFSGAWASAPTSSTAISLGNAPQMFKSVRKLFYTNTTASAITITVTLNNVTMWSKSVPANDTAELDFGANTSFGTNALKHTASATGLNWTLVGGY